MLSIFTGASLKYVIPEFASGLGKQLLHFQHIQKSAAGKVMLTNDSRRTLYFLHFLYLLISPFIGGCYPFRVASLQLTASNGNLASSARARHE